MVGLRAIVKNSRLLGGFSPKTQLGAVGRSVSNEGPAFVIRQMINKGQLKSDYRQAPVVDKLQGLYEDLSSYSPGKLFSGRPPQGLYIYGSVGSGKTTLMDVFFRTSTVRLKRRAHFNNFMADVHSRIHRLKGKRKYNRHFWEKHPSTDVITPVAKQLVSEAWLLCLDEFQVTDIADAMILKGLFTEMFENGMVMVATSNRAPEDLYKNGLQRTNFLPFIPVLKKHCNVVAVSGGKDYRTSSAEGTQKRYLIIGEQNTKAEMEEAFRKLCHEMKKRSGPRTLDVLGHQITFKNTCGPILFASFKELCDKNLGTADYIKIANTFNTILIKGIPIMSMEKRNQARRFILLIDTLYDKKVRVILSAAGPPKSLFSGLSEVSASALRSDQTRALMDDLRIEGGSENAKSSLFSGSEEVFAVDRTVSRIIEMCSNSYWNQNKK